MKKVLLTLGILSIPAQLIADDTSSLAFHAGAFDVSRSDTATELGIEYRFAPLKSTFDLIPVVGLTVNSDGAYWAHTGLRYDLSISDDWLLTPHFAVAAYEDGGGLDLGDPIEFRSGIELGYQMRSARLALGIYHLSNANLGDSNPGAESVYLSYSFELD